MTLGQSFLIIFLLVRDNLIWKKRQGRGGLLKMKIFVVIEENDETDFSLFNTIVRNTGTATVRDDAEKINEDFSL